MIIIIGFISNQIYIRSERYIMSKKLSYLLIGVTLLAIVGCSKDSFKEASKETTNDTEATTEA